MTSILNTIKEQHEIALIALEALIDDVMKPDKQGMEIKAFINTHTDHFSKFTVSWTWHGYSNSKDFDFDENMAVNVKAYCFDLIIMTRNL